MMKSRIGPEHFTGGGREFTRYSRLSNLWYICEQMKTVFVSKINMIPEYP